MSIENENVAYMFLIERSEGKKYKFDDLYTVPSRWGRKGRQYHCDTVFRKSVENELKKCSTLMDRKDFICSLVIWLANNIYNSKERELRFYYREVHKRAKDLYFLLFSQEAFDEDDVRVSKEDILKIL